MSHSTVVLSQLVYIILPRHERSLLSVSRVLGEMLSSFLLCIGFTFHLSCSSSFAIFLFTQPLPVVAFLRVLSFPHWVLAYTEVLTHPLEFFLFISRLLFILRLSYTCILLVFADSFASRLFLYLYLFLFLSLFVLLLRLNQIPSQNVRGAYNKVRISSGQCRLLNK